MDKDTLRHLLKICDLLTGRQFADLTKVEVQAVYLCRCWGLLAIVHGTIVKVWENNI